MSRRANRRLSRSGGSSSDTSRWLVSYADLITVLLIFFIVMFSMSQLNEEKYAEVAQALSRYLSGQSSGNSLIEVPPASSLDPKMMPATAGDSPVGQEELRQLLELMEKIEAWSRGEGLGGQVDIQMEGRGLVVSMADSVFFEKGSAYLRPEAREVLRKMVPMLKEIDNQIDVQGSTDDLPLISTAIYADAWELSTARATQVVRYLVSQGIPHNRLSVTGLGEWHPRYPNDSEENRAKNRRVDIVILREAASIPEL